MTFYKGKINRTAEFQRIDAIPRRVWTEEQTAEAVQKMTRALKTPTGTMTLKPLQAQALTEIGLYGGLFGPIPVGEGKTLISLLASYVLDAAKPVLLLPAALIEKTQRERIELSKHWLIPLNIKMISIESLGRASKANELDMWQPDLVIIDEAHRVKNKKAGVVRRLVRLAESRPQTKWIIMSGTMTRDGLDDFEHLAAWTLKDRVPLPQEQGEFLDWCEVLDKSRDLRRVDAGALLDWCAPEDKGLPKFTAARRGFMRRLNETPGVIASSGAEVACSIYINSLEFDVEKATEDNFRKLRLEWRTPDDWDLMQAVDVWRHACELALGLHYVWDPRPPKAWLEARSDWNKFVREILSKSRNLDTPHQVQIAVAEGELAHGKLYLDRWKDIEQMFRPNTRPVWHDQSALNACVKWGQEAPGIIWTEHSFFGRALAKMGGWQYFGRDGVNEAGVPIDLPKSAHEGKTIVASRKANSTGRNLQAWNRALITSIPGCDMEQTIGRIHRPGQEADEVQVDIIFACAEHITAWKDAVEGAAMVNNMFGQKQKLLLADKELDIHRIQMLKGSRWVKTLSEKDSKFVLPSHKSSV